MESVVREFVSDEQKNFKYKLGNALASSLSGFIAGVIFASIVWIVVLALEKFNG